MRSKARIVKANGGLSLKEIASLTPDVEPDSDDTESDTESDAEFAPHPTRGRRSAAVSPSAMALIIDDHRAQLNARPASASAPSKRLSPYQARRRLARTQAAYPHYEAGKVLDGKSILASSSVEDRLRQARDFTGGLKGGHRARGGRIVVGGWDAAQVYDRSGIAILYRGWHGAASQYANLQLMELEIALRASGMRATYGPGAAKRGPHSSFAFGATRGSMKAPRMSRYTRDHDNLYRTCQGRLEEVRGMVNKILRAIYPAWYAHVCRAMDFIHTTNPDVEAAFYPFASFCMNFGERVVADPHIDAQNWSTGLCVVIPYGTFDPSKSASLVLHELGVEVKIAPGVPVFFPSALYTHFNTAFHASDLGLRGSFVAWIGGALMQYYYLGGRSIADLSPHELAGHKARKLDRLREGLALYGKVV